MICPPYPINEQERQASLESYKILNTLPEKDFDDITTLCAFICDARVALISLLDGERNWFKSAHGFPSSEAPRELSFCGHAITSDEDLMVVEDARKDPRFCDNPFVTDLKEAIFYLGVPLINSDGYKLGTLCVFDNKPKKLSEQQITSMKSLARQVINLFEYKKRNLHLELLSQELSSKNELLKEFAGNVSHDIKMPLASIITTTDVIKKKFGELIGEAGQHYMTYLKESAFALSDYINGMLDYYTNADTLESDAETFMLNDILEDVIDMLNIKENCEIITPEINLEITSNKSALKQIFLNLITNALKYNDKDVIYITIEAEKLSDTVYNFKVSDNGIGIPNDQLTNIFNLFKVVSLQDRQGKKGNGIGLSTVKKLVHYLGGQISVTSEVGKGTTFFFSILKSSADKKTL